MFSRSVCHYHRSRRLSGWSSRHSLSMLSPCRGWAVNTQITQDTRRMCRKSIITIRTVGTINLVPVVLSTLVFIIQRNLPYLILVLNYVLRNLKSKSCCYDNYAIKTQTHKIWSIDLTVHTKYLCMCVFKHKRAYMYTCIKRLTTD